MHHAQSTVPPTPLKEGDEVDITTLAPLTGWLLIVMAAYFEIGLFKKLLGKAGRKWPQIKAPLLSDILELGIIAGAAFAVRTLPLLHSLTVKLQGLATELASGTGAWAPTVIAVIVTVAAVLAAVWCGFEFRATRSRLWLLGFILSVLVLGFSWPVFGDIVQTVFFGILAVAERLIIGFANGIVSWTVQ